MISLGKNKISYVYSGLFSTDNSWIHPSRTETTYEIIFVIDGVVYIEEDGVKYQLEKEDLLILKPNINHKGYKTSHGKTSFYWVHFNVDNYDDLQIVSNKYKFTNFSLFKELLHIAHNPNHPPYAADAALLSILGELSYLSKIEYIQSSKIIAEAAEWIRINSTRKITVSEVAKLFGYNTDHFSRLFFKYSSIKLKDYIIRERINQACNLLCNTSYSVKEIASILNFDSLNQFVHYFKYHKKMTPGKFRNLYFNIHMNKS